MGRVSHGLAMNGFWTFSLPSGTMLDFFGLGFCLCRTQLPGKGEQEARCHADQDANQQLL